MSGGHGCYISLEVTIPSHSLLPCLCALEPRLAEGFHCSSRLVHLQPNLMDIDHVCEVKDLASRLISCQ